MNSEVRYCLTELAIFTFFSMTFMVYQNTREFQLSWLVSVLSPHSIPSLLKEGPVCCLPFYCQCFAETRQCVLLNEYMLVCMRLMFVSAITQLLARVPTFKEKTQNQCLRPSLDSLSTFSLTGLKRPHLQERGQSDNLCVSSTSTESAKQQELGKYLLNESVFMVYFLLFCSSPVLMDRERFCSALLLKLLIPPCGHGFGVCIELIKGKCCLTLVNGPQCPVWWWLLLLLFFIGSCTEKVAPRTYQTGPISDVEPMN